MSKPSTAAAEAGSTHFSNDRPTAPSMDVHETPVPPEVEGVAQSAVPTADEPGGTEQNNEATADLPNDSPSTETRPAKETLLALYLAAMKKKPPKCFFPGCSMSLDMTHLSILHLSKVIDHEIPKDQRTYRCLKCSVKFAARDSYLKHVRTEDWKREPPAWMGKNFCL